MRVAVVGGWHVHTMEYATAIQKNPNAELACLWDDVREDTTKPEPGKMSFIRGEKLAQQLGIPFVENLDDIWNDPTIDAVQITTATSQHREVLLAAAKAGKHIFTEKVLTFTNEEAEEVAKAIKESSVKFTISYPHKTFPTLLAAKQLVDSGKLGKITYGRVRNVHNGSIADWLPANFYDASQTGGGAMMDLGAHPMYTLRWFMGEPKSIVSQFTDVTNRGVEDNAVSVLEFENGAIGVSETGFVTTGIGYVMEMSGTEGSLIVHNDILEYACAETENKLVQLSPLPEKDTMPIDRWIDAVINDTEAPNGIEDAVALTKFMVGAYEAAKTGKKYTF